MKRLGVDLRPGEGSSACLLFLAFALLFSFQYATKSIRQATFVDSLGAEKLPWVYLLVALCSYPLLRVYGRFAARTPYHRVVIGTCVTVALSLGGFWWLLREPAAWETMILYVWLAIVFALTVSQFWFLASRIFDSRQARRLFGFVGAGALLGSVAGGQVARFATVLVDTRFALLVAALLILLAAAVVHSVSRLDARRSAIGESTEPESWGHSRGGLDSLRRSRHLQLIALILTLGVIVSQIVDLQFNWAVEQATTGLDQRTAYFGNLYSIIGLSAFAFQLLLTSRIHRALGVGVALRVLPVTMAVGSGGLLAAAGLFPTALLRLAQGLKIGENGLRYSLDLATRELLFLPIPAAQRVQAKAFVDVFIQRAAKGLAALLLLPVTFGLASPVQMAWLSVLLTLAWLVATRSVRREYIRSFRTSLQGRRVDPGVPIKISDSTTLELLIQSLGSPDPRQVLNSLEVLSAHGRGNLVLPLLLHHDDAAVRRRTLEILDEAERRDAVPLIERRLRDPEPDIRALAIRVLARLSGRDARELMLPRLEEGNPEVRAAAVAFLINHGADEEQRFARKVLRELLTDGEPPVRAEAAKALSSIPEPLLEEAMVRLLYDENPGVCREAIRAVGSRLESGDKNPIYLPILVSLLANRRLKHDVRTALGAYGEAAIPALVHFMCDPEEAIWVRRALPKAVARVGSSSAAEGLLDCLRGDPEPFLRRKVIEALGSMGHRVSQSRSPQVVEEVRHEVRSYLTALRDLRSLEIGDRFRLDGPKLRWVDRQNDPSLIERLLIESLDDYLKNSFGLLALRHEPEHLWSAYLGLLGRRRGVRSHALEFLDNTLAASERADLFIMIDDLPVAEKLRLGAERFGIETRSKVDTLEALLRSERVANDRLTSLAAAAAYAIYTDRIAALYPLLAVVAEEGKTTFVRETARWAAQRVPAARSSDGLD